MYADNKVLTVFSYTISNFNEIAEFELWKFQKWYEVNKLTSNKNKTPS